MTLSELGWQPFFEEQVTVDEKENLVAARVAAHHGNQVLFLSDQGELTQDVSLVEEDQELGFSEIAVGDWYLLEPKTFRAVRRLERKTSLARKAAGREVRLQVIAANVDTAWIVCSCNLDFNLSRIERYLTLIHETGCQPVVVLTKADLCDDPAALRQSVEKIQSGLIVETLDARDPEQVQVLKSWCSNGKTVALLGSSGVGKSTLVNALGNLEIKTGSIREDDDKGRHTTTSRMLHRMPAGGWLLDNPGMRELQLTGSEESVDELFEDISALARECRFRNCEHVDEPGCAVQSAIEEGQLDNRRLNSFRKLQSEQKRNSATLAERRRKDRKQGAFYKKVISGKKQRREGGN